MKLYYTKGACSLAVRIIIHELNIDCEYIAVDLKTKQTEHHQSFLDINKKGSVPVIELDNKQILTENNIILHYLADQYQGEALLPDKSQFTRYQILEWANYVSTELHKTCAPFFSPSASDELKNNILTPLLKNKLNYVDQHLKNRNYLVSDHFTLPDAYLFVILSWLPIINFDFSQWPDLKKYHLNLAKRPSIVASLKEEGLI